MDGCLATDSIANCFKQHCMQHLSSGIKIERSSQEPRTFYDWQIGRNALALATHRLDRDTRQPDGGDGRAAAFGAAGWPCAWGRGHGTGRVLRAQAYGRQQAVRIQQDGGEG
jgi:hypothetical protein